MANDIDQEHVTENRRKQKDQGKRHKERRKTQFQAWKIIALYPNEGKIRFGKEDANPVARREENGWNTLTEQTRKCSGKIPENGQLREVTVVDNELSSLIDESKEFDSQASASVPVTLETLVLSAKANKMADRKKNPGRVRFCGTRTVEWPSTQEVGKEKNKLLFILALGLIPKTDMKPAQPNVTVKIKKLNHSLTAVCTAVTKNPIFKPIRQQATQTHFQSFRKPPRLVPQVPVYLDPETGILMPLKLLPEIEEPRVSAENVEVISLD